MLLIEMSTLNQVAIPSPALPESVPISKHLRLLMSLTFPALRH